MLDNHVAFLLEHGGAVQVIFVDIRHQQETCMARGHPSISPLAAAADRDDNKRENRLLSKHDNLWQWKKSCIS